MKNRIIFFPTLDGLRFFAFLCVFLHHVAFYLTDFSQSFFWTFFRINGWFGVDIFLCLTGFLVTLLLLEERKNNHQFSYKNFLIRRAVRIWPLYFVTLIFGFFITPFFFENILQVSYLSANYIEQVTTHLPWYLLFLGNWSVVFNGYGDFRSISQLWVIGVDQQFYIFWPIVLMFLKDFKKSIIISFGIICMSFLIRVFLVNIGTQHPGIYTNTFARLDTLMIGAILAFVYFYKPHVLDKLKIVYSLFLQVIIFILFVGFLYFSSSENIFAIRNGIWGYLIVALFSTYLILLSIKSNSIVFQIFNINLFKKLGKISYGLYIWHILALELVFYLIPLKNNFLVPILGLPLVIILGILSYKIFEMPFLKLKSRFS